MIALLVVGVAIGMAAFAVYAQVTRVEGGPFDLGLMWTYAWIVGVSMLGGFASFYQKVRKGQARWVNLGELLGELVTSALAGLLTYWLCRASGVSEWMTAAFVGIGGHMGSRALFVLERLLERWLERLGGNGNVTPPAPRGAPGDER